VPKQCPDPLAKDIPRTSEVFWAQQPTLSLWVLFGDDIEKVLMVVESPPLVVMIYQYNIYSSVVHTLHSFF
jgi:hypothetical protein